MFFHFLGLVLPPCPHPTATYLLLPGFPVRLASGWPSSIIPDALGHFASYHQPARTDSWSREAGWGIYRRTSVKKLKDKAGIELLFTIITPAVLTMVKPWHPCPASSPLERSSSMVGHLAQWLDHFASKWQAPIQLICA